MMKGPTNGQLRSRSERRDICRLEGRDLQKKKEVVVDAEIFFTTILVVRTKFWVLRFLAGLSITSRTLGKE